MTKRITFILFLMLCFCCPLKAQYLNPNEVPQEIKNTLNLFFPDAKVPIWKAYNAAYFRVEKYIATFTYQNKRTWATIDSSGNLLIIETAIEKDSIPVFVKEYISAKHKFTNFVEARNIFLAERKLILTVVKGRKIYYSILFDEEGVLLDDQSSLASWVFSFVIVQIIPDFGFIKPYKIKDGLFGPPKIEFKGGEN